MCFSYFFPGLMVVCDVTGKYSLSVFHVPQVKQRIHSRYPPALLTFQYSSLLIESPQALCPPLASPDRQKSERMSRHIKMLVITHHKKKKKKRNTEDRTHVPERFWKCQRLYVCWYLEHITMEGWYTQQRERERLVLYKHVYPQQRCVKCEGPRGDH